MPCIVLDKILYITSISVAFINLKTAVLLIVRINEKSYWMVQKCF